MKVQTDHVYMESMQLRPGVAMTTRALSRGWRVFSRIRRVDIYFDSPILPRGEYFAR